MTKSRLDTAFMTLMSNETRPARLSRVRQTLVNLERNVSRLWRVCVCACVYESLPKTAGTKIGQLNKSMSVGEAGMSFGTPSMARRN